MNLLSQEAACVFLLDILAGPGQGEAAQRKARKQHSDLILEVEALKEAVHRELNSRLPKH